MNGGGEPGSLLEQERRFWDAIQRKDGPATARMIADGCLITGAQGVSSISPTIMEKLTVEGNWTIERYEIDDSSVQELRIDSETAIIAYSVTEELLVAGERLNLRANDASVWVRRNGEWLCALHTESVAGDPFGRERR
jgi:hypothetical protein